MKIGHTFANGWTLRLRHPFANQTFMIEYELEAPDGSTHEYHVDRVIHVGATGPQYLYDWITETMGEKPTWPTS